MARIDIGGDFIIRGADRPVLDNDVANKEYVDLIASGAVAPTPSGVQEWVSGNGYSQHDLATVDGFIFRALVDIAASSTDSMVNPDAGTADSDRLWERTDPVSVWGASDSYIMNNIVVFAGNLYRADSDITGPVDVSTRNPLTDDNDEWTPITGNPSLNEVTDVSAPDRVAADDDKQYAFVYNYDTATPGDSVYDVVEADGVIRPWLPNRTYRLNELVVYKEYAYRATEAIAVQSTDADSTTGNPEDNSASGEAWQRVSVRNLGDLQDIDASNIDSSTADGDYFTMRWKEDSDPTDPDTYDQLELINTIGIQPWVARDTTNPWPDDSLVFVDETIFIRNGAAITTNLTPLPADGVNAVDPVDTTTGWTWIAGPRHTTHQDHSQYTLRGVDLEGTSDAEQVLDGEFGIENVRNTLNTGQFAFYEAGGRAGAATGDGRRVIRFNVSDNQSPAVSLRDAFNLIFDDATVTQLQIVVEHPNGDVTEYQTVGNDSSTFVDDRGRARTTNTSQIWRGTSSLNGSDGAVATQYAFIVEKVSGDDLAPGDVGSGNFTVRILENHRNVTNTLTPNNIAGGTPDEVLVTNADGDTAWGTVNTDGITDDAVTTAKIADEAVTTEKVDADLTSLSVNDNRYLRTTRGDDDDDGNPTYSLTWHQIDNENNLEFDSSGNERTLARYHDGTEAVPVRSVDTSSNNFVITVAHFSPTISAAFANRTVAWDEDPGTLTFTVTNPSDFDDDYLSDVTTVARNPVTGSNITDFSSLVTPSATPGGGVDWTATFTPDTTNYIRSNASDASAYTYTGTVSFEQTTVASDGTTSTSTYGTTTDFSITWAAPTVSLTIPRQTGHAFIRPYTANINYTLAYTNIDTSTGTRRNGSTFTTNINAPGSITVSQPTAMLENVEIHPNSGVLNVTVTTDVSRNGILGGPAASGRITADDNIDYDFTYPNIYQLSDTGSDNYPTDLDDWANADADTNDGFNTGVVNLTGEGGHHLNRNIRVGGVNPRVLWFGVPSGTGTGADQPTVFQTGSSEALLVNTTTIDLGTAGNEVALGPRTANRPTGYLLENYTFYGITLQPGDTWVRIT